MTITRYIPRDINSCASDLIIADPGHGPVVYVLDDVTDRVGLPMLRSNLDGYVPAD